MEDFYTILELYADQHNMEPAAALEQWYRGGITVEELLEAALEEEGIFGYANQIIRTVRILGSRSIQDHNTDPWKEEGK